MSTPDGHADSRYKRPHAEPLPVWIGIIACELLGQCVRHHDHFNVSVTVDSSIRRHCGNASCCESDYPKRIYDNHLHYVICCRKLWRPEGQRSRTSALGRTRPFVRPSVRPVLLSWQAGLLIDGLIPDPFAAFEAQYCIKSCARIGDLGATARPSGFPCGISC